MSWSVLVLFLLACTVGETVPPEGPAMPPGTEPTPGVPAEPGDEAPPTDAERAAEGLLAEARTAYDAGELETALETAGQVWTRYAGTTAATPALWVGARSSFGLERYEEARRLAKTYADRLPSGSDAAAEARSLMALAEDALAPAADAPALIGAVLPRTGSRIMVRYGDMLLEGIELAVAEAERRQGRPVRLVVADDGGGLRTREAVSELERQGAVAIVGPLLPEQLSAAAGARLNSQLVLVSPTSPQTPGYLPQLYSVSAGDARGAQALGRYAADLRLPQAAVLYLGTPEFEAKARAFAAEFEALGGRVRVTVPYDSGTTTFGPHMEQILAAVGAPAPAGGEIVGRPAPDTLSGDAAGLPTGGQPFALFVAAPERDVPQIAPQVSFYGLDAAGVQVLGDDAWAGAGVRRVVPARDLEGVIAASYLPPDRSEGVSDPEFIRLYENRYRRSLTNPLPALGYDAANLLLQALPSRRLTPEALAQRFGLLTGIRGATGLLSVRADRIVRTPYLVMIHDGRLVAAPEPWAYEAPVPRPALGGTGTGGGR